MFRLVLAIIVVVLASFSYAQSDKNGNEAPQFDFDESLLLGYPEEESLNGILDNVLNQSDVSPGQYSLDVYINERFLSRKLVELINRDGEVVPCLLRETWQAMGVLEEYITNDVITQCLVVEDYSFDVDMSRLRLNVFVPQAYTENQPKGYIPRALWDDGEATFFTNYDANYYRSNLSSGYDNSDNDSLFVGLRTGMNIDRWRVRSQFNYSYNNAGSRTRRQLSHARTYVQTAIPDWESKLTFGQTYTSDNVFDSVTFDGVEVQSDPRMLPMSRRGYAPVIVGMADSVATVTVSQQGREIYQQTVPPGPFEINDITSPYYRGDFDVVVKEADGKTKRFTVPFHAVPGSMRLGQSRYHLAVGKMRLSDVNDEPYFAQGLYEQGITNSLTSHVGLRAAEDYLGSTVGLVLGTSYGDVGIRSSFSHTIIDDNTTNGWRAGIDYSIGFEQTDTTLTLASYRYSSQGYRTLNDFARIHGEDDLQSSALVQSERDYFSVNVDQSLPGRGRLNLSGSHTVYRNNQDATTQAQLSYSTQIGKATLNIGYLRSFDQADLTTDDVVNLGWSMPFGGSDSPTLSSFNVTSTGDRIAYQAGVSGQLAGLADTTYGLNYGLNDSKQSTVSMNVNHLSPKAAYGASVSRSDNYTQWGVSTRGGLVIHEGGMNLTESLGNTFAIIKADNAEGARIRNSRGGRIDSNGYGIANHLAPYKYNQVSLDPSTLSNPDVELKETQFRLVPTAGASVQYDVATEVGKAVLFKIEGNTVPPLGSNIMNEEGALLGMVSQAGLAYVRLSTLSGQLVINWGDKDNQQCVIAYNLEEDNKRDHDFIKVAAVCQS
ncbi:fimbria/pilus outer membrane usher protein [Salinivibrio sp. IB872]|uniref:fimbria/pilus outer membrane usher protein n=1 Tax=Salinivibrio sp. IB872 TaxID=1766123 RepID=UPI000987BDFD|nr:fimbria/pilus outer membrane usher protein [Salinivibrio sp. IB872]OOF24162.1 hypothetical protein BZJ18_13580 [Salinivibrio sp. IB872]